MGDWARCALKRRTFLALCGASLLSMRSPRARAAERKVVSIVPLGSVSRLELATVERALLSFYDLDVRISAEEALPRAAYYAPRRRYRAERLLQHLESSADASSFRVLGLASVDISTTKGEIRDWGVLGLATIAGDVSPQLARATIRSLTVLGALHASAAVKAALADRIA